MSSASEPANKNVPALALGALGVVFGDIGTSPLYAVHDGFTTVHHPIPVSPDNVLGLLSLIIWSLTIVVSIKYVVFVMNADNKGEGGIVALMALALRGKRENARSRAIITALGIFGAALFYGDGVITPAISVLAAIEGLHLATPAFDEYIVPITVLVLTGLFYLERKGTATVGVLFGPVMVVWFVTIAIMGVRNIVLYPAVFSALNPLLGIRFIGENPVIGFFSLGTVVLVLTGVEALYADMGHFGRTPIRTAWFTLVFPALALCYFGQGALILHDPATVKNPFYLMAPEWALYPLVILSTIATVIASQAVISGAYSMTQQALQLGYAPRMLVRHTSGKEIGQIYIGGINWVLYIIVIGLVLGFKSSANLAAAFGIAVSGTMLITIFLAYVVVRDQWGWSRPKALFVATPLAVIDVAFFASNAAKFADGGWFPVVFGLGIFILMTTWKKGRRLLQCRVSTQGLALQDFIGAIDSAKHRVPGTAVFMTSDLQRIPNALLHSIKHYGVLHERVVLVSIVTQDVPHVEDRDRIEILRHPKHFWCVKVHYGFMDRMDLPAALSLCAPLGLEFDMMQTTFFLGRESVIPTASKEMSLWRERLFVAMLRNAEPANSFFKLPANRVVELGSQITL